jgi:c(7)-type cytochrome triheme protein
MLTYSNRRGTKKNERGLFLLVLACGVLFLTSVVSAQIYLPSPPTPLPSNYGKVILDKYSSAGPGGVVFDHWMHRSKFTCRLCHVDIGFAMRANATGIRAETNREGFHCGACHDGKRSFEGQTIFASCSSAGNNSQCARCHSLGKKDVRKYEYKAFTARLPKAMYGIDWETAERKKYINPVDFMEGISIKKAPMQTRQDFSITTNLYWVHPVRFSHEKHAVWNGCELCHPEIFSTAPKNKEQHSMVANIVGHNCGACHGQVAFPLNNCSGCHPRGPTWM